MTLGSRLDRFGGVGPGFDFLRVALSLSILFWHSFRLSYGLGWVRAMPALPFPPLLAALLPMFFALSGFLVMGSALRTADLRVFMTFRVLRIVPALLAEVSLSALILGPVMTALPLGRYFTDPRFVEYFGSLVGRVRYVLPGLFLSNPSPEVVNGALWTVGPEILCYVLMALLLLFGLYRSRVAMTLYALVYLAMCVVTDHWDTHPIHEILPTKALILGFVAGNLMYLYRDRIRYNTALAAAIFVGCVLLNLLAQGEGGVRLAMYPAVIGLAYVTAAIGLTDIGQLPFFKGGDYSYGIYIYGYPIQQTITHFLPAHREWAVNFAVSLPLTLLFAFGSWHLIEKPFLKLRKRFLGERKPADAPPAPPWPIARPRRLLIAGGFAAYGVFVAFSASVFPVREIALDILGRHPGKAEQVRPQF